MISFLETTVAQQNLPAAAVLIAGDGEIACRTVAGLQNVETGDPCSSTRSIESPR
jgi:hypothetical protein